jgi:hypothetical protein
VALPESSKPNPQSPDPLRNGEDNPRRFRATADENGRLSQWGRLRVNLNDWLTPSRQDRKEGLKDSAEEELGHSPRFFNMILSFMILFSDSWPGPNDPHMKDKYRIIERTESCRSCGFTGKLEPNPQ